VHPSVIGRRVRVHASLDRVRVTCDGRLVADHQRCWAARQTITDPGHRDAAAVLRREYRHVTAASSPGGLEVEQRSLDVYDALTGPGEVA
jgi:hypothetical protein